MACLNSKNTTPLISPGLYYCRIAHDDWCDFLNDRGKCNCNPEITIKPVDSVEGYFEGVKNYREGLD